MEASQPDPGNPKGGAELIMAVAANGDRSAFSTLFAYFAPRVKSYFLRLGVAKDTAEELAQETMLRVWREARRFDPSRAAASTWIFTIARNLRIDMLRRSRPVSAVSSDELDAIPAETTPADALLIDEQERKVQQALKSLPRIRPKWCC